MHILSPETDNCRKGENDRRKYFMINLHERMLPTLRDAQYENKKKPLNWISTHQYQIVRRNSYNVLFSTPISLQIFFFLSGLNPRRIKIRPLHSASRNCLHIDGAGSNETRLSCRLEKYHVTSGATGILMSRRGLI